MRPKNLLQSLDLFKKPLFLRVAKQEMASTYFGIFLSCAIYVCLGYFFSQSDFFQKLNPTIVLETTQCLRSPSIFYQNKTLSFAIKDGFGNTVNDPSYFSILVVVMTVQFSDSGVPVYVSDPRSYHLCNESDATNPEDLTLLGDTYCLDNRTFVLEGGLGQPTSSSLQIQVYPCQNTTENNNSCKSIDEIQDFFIMKSFNLNYRNTIFQLKSYQVPTIEAFYSSIYKLDGRLNRLVTINLQKAYIFSDETVLTIKENRIETFAYENEKNEIGLTTSPQDPIASFLFFSSTDILTAHRSYQSLTQAFAEIGGLFSVLLILGKILSKVDNSIYLTTLLMNFLYSFQQPEVETGVSLNKLPGLIRNPSNANETEKKAETNQTKRVDIQIALEKFPMNESKRLHEPIELKNDLQNRNGVPKSLSFKTQQIEEKILKDDCIVISSTIIEPDENKSSRDSMEQKTVKFDKKMRTLSKTHKNDIESLQEFVNLNEKNNQISFSLLDFLKLMMKKITRFGLSFKEKLFERAHEVFEDEIDIVKILQKVQDIEKLKFLLLNDHQMLLFDVLEKPMIFVDENQKKFRSLSTLIGSPGLRESKSMDSKIRKAFEYYQQLEFKTSRDPIDEKLFSLIDKRFKTFKTYFHKN